MEKNSAKISLGTAICLFIIIILVGALITVYYLGFVAKNQQIIALQAEKELQKTNSNLSGQITIKEDNKEELTSKTKKITKIDNDKELVYNVKTEIEHYSDEKNKEVEAPQINLNYDNIKDINEKIINYTKNWLMGALDSKYYINDDIVSIVLTYYTEGDPYKIFVYNIDVYTGNILTNEELLYMQGITEEDLIDKIGEAEEKVYREHKLDDLDGTEDWAWFYMSRRYNGLEKGLQITMPMFINENGKLSVVIKYCFPAGSGGPWGVIVEL